MQLLPYLKLIIMVRRIIKSKYKEHLQVQKQINR